MSVKQIGAALVGHTRLTDLTVPDNRVDDRGAVALASAVAASPCLCSVYLWRESSFPAWGAACVGRCVRGALRAWGALWHFRRVECALPVGKGIGLRGIWTTWARCTCAVAPADDWCVAVLCSRVAAQRTASGAPVAVHWRSRCHGALP